MSNFEKIMQSWINPDGLLSSLAGEVSEEARRRIEAPIRAELYAKAGEWLKADMVGLDAEITALSDEIGALVLELDSLKAAHSKLEKAYRGERPENQTMQRGHEVEQARRAVHAASEKLHHLTNERQVKFVKRQSTARALALISKAL